MRRMDGFTSVAALAVMLVLASCYNVASNANDNDGDGPDGPNSGNGTPSGNGSTGSTPSGNGGSGGSSSSANGGGGSASSASASGGNGSGGSSGSGDGGSTSTGGSGTASTGSGNSTTGSSGAGGSPPAGQHYLTYRFDMLQDSPVPDQLTIYDTAMDGDDDPYPRPTPFNDTDFGMTYAWGVATDAISDLDCFAVDEEFVECQVMRPAYAYVEVDVHVQYGDADDPWTHWSCDEDPALGLFRLWIDGVETGFAYEPWPDPLVGPACHYYFILPD